MLEDLHSWRWILFLFLLAAAVSDARSYKIPNILSAGLAIAAGVILLASKAQTDAIVQSFLSGVLALIAGYLFFRLKVMGAGDGKLFAAGAMWFAPAALLNAGLLISLSGVALAVILLAVRSARPSVAGAETGRANALKTPVPYGIAIASGFILATFLQIPGQ